VTRQERILKAFAKQDIGVKLNTGHLGGGQNLEICDDGDDVDHLRFYPCGAGEMSSDRSVAGAVAVRDPPVAGRRAARRPYLRGQGGAQSAAP